MTYSEMRAVYEAANATDYQIIIGKIILHSLVYLCMYVVPRFHLGHAMQWVFTSIERSKASGDNLTWRLTCNAVIISFIKECAF